MDLSQMWFREMFIDRCSAVQFPVESSIPAMLVEHAVGSDAPLMLQSIPHVLDIYNDVMKLALDRLSRPYLFDEVEAEVAVVVRSLLSKLTVMVYRTSRDAAVARVLPPLDRIELEKKLAGSKSGVRRCVSGFSAAYPSCTLPLCCVVEAGPIRLLGMPCVFAVSSLADDREVGLMSLWMDACVRACVCVPCPCDRVVVGR